MTGVTEEQIWQSRGHQPDKVATGFITLIGLGFLGLVLVSLFFLAMLQRWLAPTQPPQDVDAAWKDAQTAPGVEPNQAYERTRYQAALDERLQSYGWEDQQRSKAHIPIDRAIEIMADRKLQTDWSASSAEASSNE